MSKLVVKHYENLWKGHFKLDRAEAVQKYSDGNEKSIKREILRVNDSVAVLLFRHDNRNIILTSQWRAPVLARGDDNNPVIEVCAGNIDSSDYDPLKKNPLEAAYQAAYREVKEETGWHISQLYHLFSLYSSPGITTEKLYYFIASVDKQDQKGGGLRQEGENIEILEMKLTLAFEWIKENKIVDLKTVFLLQYFRNNINLFM